MPACGAAQGLQDPTAPPNASDAAGDVPSGPRLQSVILSTDRKLAVIDGAAVPLGGRAGDAILIRIGVAEVTLKRGDQYETLYMFPGGVQRRGRAAPAQGKKEGVGP